jgi:hypothetical protein
MFYSKPATTKIWPDPDPDPETKIISGSGFECKKQSLQEKTIFCGKKQRRPT